jgi:hypothetical protein
VQRLSVQKKKRECNVRNDRLRVTAVGGFCMPGEDNQRGPAALSSRSSSHTLPPPQSSTARLPSARHRWSRRLGRIHGARIGGLHSAGSLCGESQIGSTAEECWRGHPAPACWPCCASLPTAALAWRVADAPSYLAHSW